MDVAAPTRTPAGPKLPLYGFPPTVRWSKKTSVLNRSTASSALDLFDMMPDAGYGRAAGDFQIGQLVQTLRSNGKYTYGKIMDYDPSGDHYTVMTKAGPKYFVEKDDITPEVVWNPQGGFARQ